MRSRLLADATYAHRPSIERKGGLFITRVESLHLFGTQVCRMREPRPSSAPARASFTTALRREATICSRVAYAAAGHLVSSGLLDFRAICWSVTLFKGYSQELSGPPRRTLDNPFGAGLNVKTDFP